MSSPPSLPLHISGSPLLLSAADMDRLTSDFECLLQHSSILPDLHGDAGIHQTSTSIATVESDSISSARLCNGSYENDLPRHCHVHDDCSVVGAVLSSTSLEPLASSISQLRHPTVMITEPSSQSLPYLLNHNTLRRPVLLLPSFKQDSAAVTPRLPPTAVIALLDLLDQCDRELTVEVARVLDSVRETREMIGGVRQRQAENRELDRIEHGRRLKEAERIKRETKEIDSDFWLGV
ncbi:hypothetical protein FISHEDRAFT_71796 [Fistulina hepatica ATCC 64428]|uniref:Uncharacterized protein n=1 Tax=Fistulina hepatica ATCC 64428 TaxID=1128425 RepID=A0A0D7AFS9_9AGAR|nr:hypothetical protein FISHEDRAFT_71796 [Fistulina hepatica ATCC 64428]